MGYVSLQKPNEYFNKYMRTRLRRDILRSWLLSAEGKESKVDESKIPSLITDLFRELDYKIAGTIANKIAGGNAVRTLRETLECQDSASDKLNSELVWGGIQSMLSDVKRNIENESKTTDKRDAYKKVLVEGIWSQAERWIRQSGLTFAYDAVDKVRSQMAEDFKAAETKAKNVNEKLKDQETQLENLCRDAEEINLTEKTFGSNKGDIEAYISALSSYVDEFIKAQVDAWAHDLLKDFCTDEKNDELSKLKKHIASFKDKAAEMNREAVKEYKKLAVKMSEATLDVTTVYLPQLTTICDGDGWVADNMFSKLYGTFIKAQNDKEETPERVDLTKFLNENIYNAVNEHVKEEIAKGQYIFFSKKVDDKTGKEVATEEVRFFCQPDLERSNEKVIDDFLTIVMGVFDKKLSESKDIQEKWETKRVSAFFDDLTNDQKDLVRNSLNPSLFFSYNTSRIEVTKKEEHIVFVAGTEDLAVEMLGFQKGNPKHRYEKADSDDVALVLKSKYGLSLEDYRIYDSIKSVYDRATFREKYHFHHDFAQYLDKLTLDDMPEEVLPQHRTYAKMLILDSFKEEMKEFFYEDEYDKELYTNSMLIQGDCDTEFKVAQPEAFYTDSQTAKLTLKVEENGRPLFVTIDGDNFAQQFNKYCRLFYNYRIGETTEAILQSLLRQKGLNASGEQILKRLYPEKRKALLQLLHDKKKNASLPAEQRLYNVLFTIVREEFENVQKFIK
jgi:hypothetical protein